jgi:protein-S-isoprenylcysteine O-methyltransferase Ste14
MIPFGIPRALLVTLGLVLSTVIQTYVRKRFRPKPAVRRQDTQRFDTNLEMSLGCLSFVIAASLYFFLIFPDWFKFAQLPQSYLTLGLALVLFPAGGLLYHVARATLADNFIGGVGLQADHQLITSGPYRWIRNPIYLSYLLVGVAAGLLFANAYVMFCLVSPTVAMMMRVPHEERVLEAHFGDAYTHYKSQTGRFLPRLRKPRP